MAWRVTEFSYGKSNSEHFGNQVMIVSKSSIPTKQIFKSVHTDGYERHYGVDINIFIAGEGTDWFSGMVFIR